MTASPRVSVLMSVYNGARYLREAVDSILDQSFGDFEFIIVDDGSSDGTPAILDSYADPRIVRLHNETNIGLTRSLNKGLAAARGEYVARQDADDISLPERLAKQVAYLDIERKITLVGTAHIEIDAEGKTLRTMVPLLKPAEIKDHLLYQSCFCHGSVMMRLMAATSVGGYRESLSVTQDRDLWIRLADIYELANLPEPLYLLRITRSSISSRRRRLQREIGAQLTQMTLQQRQRAGSGYNPTPIPSGRAYFLLALHALSRGEEEGARMNLQAALLANPNLDDDADYLTQQIVQRAFETGDWENIDERTEFDATQGLRYLHRIFQLLPAHLHRLHSYEKKSIAYLHAAYGFATFKVRDRLSSRKHFLRAWQHDWAYVRNLGIWTTLFRTFLITRSQ